MEVAAHPIPKDECIPSRCLVRSGVLAAYNICKGAKCLTELDSHAAHTNESIDAVIRKACLY